MPCYRRVREASLQRVTLFPLLAPALVCYLIADIAASIGQLDLLGWVIGATALGLSLTARSRDSVSAPYGVRALPWLGFSASIALLRVLSDQPSRLFVGMLEACALCVVGASVFDQALRVPDRLGSLRFSRVARGMTYGLGAASALVSVLALAGARVPLHYASAALWYAGLCVVYALCVRLLRPRLGSSPDALASNAWGSLALAPAAALAVSIAFPAMRTARPYLPLWAAGSALALYVGHAFMVDPKRRLSASRVTRDSLAATGALVLMAAAVAAAGNVMPREPLPLALWTAGTLLVALGVFFTLRGLARQLLAPFGGRLLRALSDVEHSLAGVQTREELARIVLGGLREACGSRSAQPVLYGFEPTWEARLDAAGAAHVREQGPHAQLLERLEEQPGEILVRATLEARIVRIPLLRPLLEVLQEHDVLCVVPLIAEGQLEGAFLLPRGQRRSPLTLEELIELRRHARWLTGLFTLFASRSRAELRAHDARQANVAASRRVQELSEENTRAREALSLLHGGRMRRMEAPALIAYSPAMRALQAHLRTLTALESPVLFVAEPGLPVEPLARFLHVEAGRPAEPFVIVDCAALRVEQAETAVFGSAVAADGGAPTVGEEAGCLRAADTGSLLLLDVAALPRSVQRRLASTLVSGIARPAGGGLPYRVHARVVASSRVSLRELVEQGRCEAELAAPFEAFVCRVPPLRECPEDFESHVLLALDRACRRLSRELLGIEPDALARLRAERWTENMAQLQTVLDRAAEVATGARITAGDLERSHALSAGAHPLEGNLDEVERRALLHALARANGNKSETARLLGIPRTTLLDKLRRHKLDDTTSQRPPTAPN